MSGEAEKGFEAYEELYNMGVNLVFLKEPHINTEVYKKALQSNIELQGNNVDLILQGVNAYLMELAKEIEESRMAIGKKYGEATEDGYTIPAEKIEEANKEYEELMTLEQEVNICTISIDKLPDDLELTTAQVDALSYMIAE